MLAAVAPATANESGLGELRLFFSNAQRQADGDIEPDAAAAHSSSADSARSESTGQHRQAPAGAVAGAAADQTMPKQIAFTALVQGPRFVQVLINGLPCQPIQRLVHDDADNPVPLSCPLELPRGLQLHYLAKRHRVQVLDKGRVVAQLSVGGTV